MKYDFSGTIPSIFGGAIKESAASDAADITFKTAAITALLSKPSQDSFDQKAKVFDLASRINANPQEVDMKSEEVTLLKKAIGEVYNPAICGPFEKLLEGEVK